MSITYRGTDLNSFGLKLQLTQGFRDGLSVRGKDYIVPGARGRVAMPRRADVRRLIIEGWVQGDDSEDWRESTDLFHEIFDVELDAGTIVITGPYLGIPVGVSYSIGARVLNTMPGQIQGDSQFQHWSIELESVDPDWAGGGSGS
jgi:hypothetical protein